MNHLTYVPYSEDDIDYVNTEMESSYDPPNYRDLQKYQQLAYTAAERINVEKFFKQNIKNFDNTEASNTEFKYNIKEENAKLPDYTLFSDSSLNKKYKSLKNKVLKNLFIIRNTCFYCNPLYKVKSIPNFRTDNIVSIAALDNICKIFEAPRVDQNTFKYIDMFSKGSFTEYLLWKGRKNNIKVTGHIYNVKDNNIHSDVFVPKNDENINVSVYDCEKDSNLKNENIKKFIEFITEKMDLVCSGYTLDYDDEDLLQENIEEDYYQKFLIQIIISLSTLNNGGNIILKVYDLYQSFTVELMYILAAHFEKFSVVNSVSTSINNCKRYIFCQNFKGVNEEVINYLYDVNEKMNEITNIGTINWHKLLKDKKMVVSHIIENEIDEDFVIDMQSLNMKYLILQNEYYERLLSMMFEHYRYSINISDVIRECQKQWNLV